MLRKYFFDWNLNRIGNGQHDPLGNGFAVNYKDNSRSAATKISGNRCHGRIFASFEKLKFDFFGFHYLASQMGEFMFDIKNDEILSIVSRYCLVRDEGHIYIDILEHVAGDFNKKFTAIPVAGSLWAKKFRISANTKEEALDKCLDLLKDANLKDHHSLFSH